MWKQYHLAQPEGIDIIRSAANTRVPRTNCRRSTVPREVRLWQVQRKPTHRQSHKPWIQVHDDPAVRVREHATEGSAYPNGFDAVSCDTCMETVIPIPDTDGYAQSWRHACSADLAPGAENATIVEHLRDGCTRSQIHFVSELFAFPELLEQAAQGLEEHDFADVVRRILDETVDNPPRFRHLEEEADSAPPVLVAPGSSMRWVAENAIGLAHALVAGRFEEPEGCRLPDRVPPRYRSARVRRAPSAPPSPGWERVRSLRSASSCALPRCLRQRGRSRSGSGPTGTTPRSSRCSPGWTRGT